MWSVEGEPRGALPPLQAGGTQPSQGQVAPPQVGSPGGKEMNLGHGKREEEEQRGSEETRGKYEILFGLLVS